MNRREFLTAAAALPVAYRIDPDTGVEGQDAWFEVFASQAGPAIGHDLDLWWTDWDEQLRTPAGRPQDARTAGGGA